MRHRLRSFLQRNWRGIVNGITILAMVLLVYALRHQILDTLANITKVNYWVLLLIIPIQATTYFAYSRINTLILNHLGHPISQKDLYRVALELNFVNHAFPSGGISGISYFGFRLKQLGVRASVATLLQFLRFIFAFLSYQVLIAVGLLALAIGGKSNNLMLLTGGVLATLTVVATMLFAYIVGSKERINRFFTLLVKGINRVIHALRPKHPETINIGRVRDAMTHVHESYLAVRSNKKILKSSFGYALLANICEVSAIYIVFIAFGQWVNVGAVILAYAIANIAGLVSVLPGGVGLYEFLMTAVMVAAGVPAGLSIPVIVMFRVISIAIQLLPGWVLYHRTISRAGNAG